MPKKKKKLTLKEWERIKEAKLGERAKKKMIRHREKQELREERNLTGTQAFAAMLGRLKAGRELPF